MHVAGWAVMPFFALSGSAASSFNKSLVTLEVSILPKEWPVALMATPDVVSHLSHVFVFMPSVSHCAGFVTVPSSQSCPRAGISYVTAEAVSQVF